MDQISIDMAQTPDGKSWIAEVIHGSSDGDRYRFFMGGAYPEDGEMSDVRARVLLRVLRRIDGTQEQI